MKAHLGTLAACAIVLAAAPAFAAHIQAGEDAFVDVKVLVQGTGQLRDGAAADGRGMGTDFYLRRARLMLFGNVSKNISFFIETDSPNFGKGGDYQPSLYIQDAFASFRVADELTFDAGLIIIPLAHHTIQGAVSLNTLDYHAFLVKYPQGSTKVWRDAGVQAHGMLMGGKVHYRLGAFGGVRSKGGRHDGDAALPDLNPDGVPRFAGMLRYNLLDAEDGFFPAGIYFGKKKVISFGIGADYQPGAVATGAKVADARAFAGDLFVDLPIDERQEVVFQADVIGYDHGEDANASGVGFFVEGGYRYWKIEPVVAYERFFSSTGKGDFQGIHAGLNYWALEHTANVKADVAVEKDAAAQQAESLAGAGNRTSITLQTQLFF